MPAEEHTSTVAQLKDDFTRLPLKDLGKRAYKKIGADQVTTMSGAFAYSWTFSIPPLILLTVLFAALLNKVTNVPVVENMQDAIKKHAPADTQEMLLRMVDNAVAKVGGNAASLGVILTAILALWAASNAIGVLITGFNRAYDVEEDRSFLKKKGVQLGLTLMLVLFVNAVVALLVFGQQIGNWLADWIGVGRHSIRSGALPAGRWASSGSCWRWPCCTGPGQMSIYRSAGYLPARSWRRCSGSLWWPGSGSI